MTSKLGRRKQARRKRQQNRVKQFAQWNLQSIYWQLHVQYYQEGFDAGYDQAINDVLTMTDDHDTVNVLKMMLKTRKGVES